MENFDENKLFNAVDSTAKTHGIDPSVLKNAIKSKDVNGILNSLNENQAKMLNDTLRDKTALDKLLKSPEAQKLMKKLMK